MIPPVDSSQLSPPAQKLLGAPPKIVEMAARGIAPGIRPAELLLILSVLTRHESAAIRDTAQRTLSNLPEPVIAGAIGTPLPAQAIHELATRYPDRLDVLAAVFGMADLADETVEEIAKIASEPVTELIATNEERLLKHPKIIENLYLNRNTRMSTADRMVELAARNNVVVGIPAWKEAVAAIQNELIAEATEEPSPDDLMFREAMDAVDAVRGSDDDTHEQAEDGHERVKEKFKTAQAKIDALSISGKVRLAMTGSHEEVFILVRNANRMIAVAAARSPALTESDAEKLATNRSISSDVLRIIGDNPEFIKRYTVKKALAENPKTPISLALNMVKYLREGDLRLLEKSRNVSGPVRDAIRNHLARRKS